MNLTPMQPVLMTAVLCLLSFLSWYKWNEHRQCKDSLINCNEALGECKTVLQTMRTEGKEREQRILSEIRMMQNQPAGQIVNQLQNKLKPPVYIFSGTSGNKIFHVDANSARRWGLHVVHDTDSNLQSLRDTLNYLRAEQLSCIIHFACHGDENALNLNGTIDAVSLSEMMSGIQSPLIVLAACDSFGIARRLKAPDRTIVSMLNKIESRDAEIFSDALYEKIAKGRSVEFAVGEALRLSPVALSEGTQIIYG